MVLSREKGLALKHLSEDATGTPNIHLNIILLPREHNLGCAVISRRNVARHLGVLNASQTEVANLQIAVFVDQNVAWLQIAMDNAGRVHVFQSAHDLVQKVLDELLFKRSRGEEAMEIGAEQFGDEVADSKSVPSPIMLLPVLHLHIFQWRDEDVTEGDNIFVLQVLQQLELSVCSLGKYGSAEGLHDLLDGDIGAGELVFGGAMRTFLISTTR